jgi:hypothetical protein
MLTETTKEILSSSSFLKYLVFLLAGVFFLFIGFTMLRKKTFFQLNSVNWIPVNEEKLSRRVGILFVVVGVAIIVLPFSVMWLGAIAGNVIGVVVLICFVLMAISFLLDRLAS